MQNFLTMVEAEYHNPVKVVRSDNGPELLMPLFYASKGIEHQTSCVDLNKINLLRENTNIS